MDKKIGILTPHPDAKEYTFFCQDCKKILGTSVIPWIKCPKCKGKYVVIYNPEYHAPSIQDGVNSAKAKR